MTTGPSQGPASAPPPVLFLEGVVKHLQAFAAATGVAPGDVFVRLTLADGATVFSQGLNVSGPCPAGPAGWGLIESDGGTAAVVVREAHVLKVEFNLSPERHRPIGLHAEVNPP